MMNDRRKTLDTDILNTLPSIVTSAITILNLSSNVYGRFSKLIPKLANRQVRHVFHYNVREWRKKHVKKSITENKI